MEAVDKGCLMTRIGVSGWMFLLVPAHPGSPEQMAVKRLCVLNRVEEADQQQPRQPSWGCYWRCDITSRAQSVFVLQRLKYSTINTQDSPDQPTRKAQFPERLTARAVVVSTLWYTLTVMLTSGWRGPKAMPPTARNQVVAPPSVGRCRRRSIMSLYRATADATMWGPAGLNSFSHTV